MLAKTPDRVADYLAAIGRVAPTVAEHRASFDRERRLPNVVFNALADEGLFRLWLPEALGGSELSPVEFMKNTISYFSRPAALISELSVAILTSNP